jgi:hypothetical protein
MEFSAFAAGAHARLVPIFDQVLDLPPIAFSSSLSVLSADTMESGSEDTVVSWCSPVKLVLTE